tara:strand:- start:775 stop:1491 length:717 start_codon:yes stop_codon:yes gene_type:complete
MSKFSCLRCGYSTDNKSRFKKHLFRKYTCPPTEKDVSIKEILVFYKLEDTSYDTKLDENEHNNCCIGCIKKIIELEACFAYIRQELINTKIECQLKLNEFEGKLNTNTSNISKTNCNNNTTTNNIIINNYGPESQRFLTETMLSGLINSPNKTIPQMLDKINDGHEDVYDITDEEMELLKEKLKAINYLKSKEHLKDTIDDFEDSEYEEEPEEIIEDIVYEMIDHVLEKVEKKETLDI